jgi:hypothetical protein
MKKLGITIKIIRMIKMTMAQVLCSVRIQTHLSNSFKTIGGLTQRDALACLLVNTASEKAIQDPGIQTRGTIFYKTTQLLTYADDIDIMSQTLHRLKHTFTSLKESAQKMGLETNQEKTMYMYSGKDGNKPNSISIGEYKFQRADRFKYLGSMIEKENRRTVEIKNCLMLGNRSYYSLMGHLKSKIINRKIKLLLYKTVIRHVLTYGAETWVMTKQDEEYLRCFARKILHKIFGPKYQGDNWCHSTNRKLYELFKEEDVVKFIKLSRLRWAGNVMRLNDNGPTKKVLMSQPGESRTRGRPKLRWEDLVTEDAARAGWRNWKRTAHIREDWQKLLKEAKAHPGL